MTDRIYLPAQIEIRSDDDGATLSGIAAVYHDRNDPGTEYELGFLNTVERIAPGAFDRALSEKQDVRALFNHDDSKVLGRTKSGTLTLTAEKRGLRYDVRLPDTSFARDLAESVKRGDITQSSFGFKPTNVKWSNEAGRDVRTIVDADLFDVSPVTFPAYKATEVSVRHEARDEYDAWQDSIKQEQAQLAAEIAYRNRSLRLLEIS